MIRTSVLAALVLLMIAPRSEGACGGVAPTFQAFRLADAVFIGRVIYVGPTSRSRTSADGVVVESLAPSFRLRVEERLRGEVPDEVTLVDPRIAFRLDERYLVYAMRAASGALTTNECTRTRAVAEADQDLRYIRGLSSAAATGTVYGLVHVGVVDATGRLTARRAVPREVVVAIEGPGGRSETRSAWWGSFEFNALSPGLYTLSVNGAEVSELRVVTSQDRRTSVVADNIDVGGSPVEVMVLLSAAPDEGVTAATIARLVTAGK